MSFVVLCCFFFKQKTAYEMRISDWSSDCALPISIVFVVIALVIGGSIGAVLARRIQMTAMPQLVAAMHSLVGLAAVLVAAAAFYNPEPYGILHDGEIGRASGREGVFR